MKNHLTIFLLISLLTTSTAGAQSNSDSPFLWSAEKNGKTSYLFGTIHLPIPLEYIKCAELIFEQIKNSDLIILENLYSKTEVNDFFYQAVNVLHQSEDGHEFKSLKPEVQDFFNKNNLPYTHLTYMGYMILLTHTVGQEVINRFDLHSVDTIDRQVKKIGESQNTSLKALDSEADIKRLINEQVAHMESLVYATHNTDIITSMTVESAVYRYRHSVAIQRRGIMHLSKVYLANMTNSSGKSPKQNSEDEFVLNQRNQKWLSEFLEAHQNHERIFITVGVAHLTKENNLIDKLTTEGFTVRRVSCDQNQQTASVANTEN